MHVDSRLFGTVKNPMYKTPSALGYLIRNLTEVLAELKIYAFEILLFPSVVAVENFEKETATIQWWVKI